MTSGENKHHKVIQNNIVQESISSAHKPRTLSKHLVWARTIKSSTDVTYQKAMSDLIRNNLRRCLGIDAQSFTSDTPSGRQVEFYGAHVNIRCCGRWH